MHTLKHASFSLVAAWGAYSVAAVRGLLVAVASLVIQHRLWGAGASVAAARGLGRCSSHALEYRLGSCGAWAQLF